MVLRSQALVSTADHRPQPVRPATLAARDRRGVAACGIAPAAGDSRVAAAGVILVTAADGAELARCRVVPPAGYDCGRVTGRVTDEVAVAGQGTAVVATSGI